MLKCPVCQSTRIKKIKGKMRCAKCGYINLSEKELNKNSKTPKFK